MDFSAIATEGRNPDTIDIDRLDSLGIVTRINSEDKKVAPAVEKCLPQIAVAVDFAVEALRQGGRVFYIGAGTSGRLGILDASECPPTYGVPPELIQGIIAGGDLAVRQAVENAEDSPVMAAEQLASRGLGPADLVVGLAASGRTPYVLGGLTYAKQLGCKTVAVCCSDNAPVSKVADVTIAVLCGPEVITGSTRMKAGTAQK
ncbi:MAG: N-acetylmuramic acid 6-phosphate etherase, partial [Negativicutes bacterium]|nr:N-acetylmuramic acid 6-phosphate etherase [Negativicutes bacterium]